MRNPLRYFNSSPEGIRLAVMMYIRHPLSLRQLEYLLFEPGIDICHETELDTHIEPRLTGNWLLSFKADARPSWRHDAPGDSC